MTSPPKQYTRDDVLALIRDFISKDIGEHEAWEAWKAIKKTRSPEVVDLFEGTLVRMANVPYTLELGKRNYWASSAAVKRLSRIPAMAERAARDVEWVSSHPMMNRLQLEWTIAKARSEAREDFWRDVSTRLLESANSLRMLAKLIRRESKRFQHAKVRKTDLIADETRIFLSGLDATGRLDLEQAARILQPIYASLGIRNRKLNAHLPNLDFSRVIQVAV